MDLSEDLLKKPPSPSPNPSPWPSSLSPSPAKVHLSPDLSPSPDPSPDLSTTSLVLCTKGTLLRELQTRLMKKTTKKNRNFRPINRYISETIEDRRILGESKK